MMAFMRSECMQSDDIEMVGVDANGSLWIKPATSTFPFIYRAAMEVHWDEKRRCLYAPAPRDWSYLRWFGQIVDAVRSEYHTELRIAPTTSWDNVDRNLQLEISKLLG
jgi:hypothetical protein